MLRSYGTIFQLKCARLPPPLTLTLCLLLSSRVLLFLHLSFTLVLKPTSSFIHIPLSLCLLYTSDAADEEDSVDLGGRRTIKTKNNTKQQNQFSDLGVRLFFFFKQKTAYEIGVRLVGSEMCIRDSLKTYLFLHSYPP